MPTEQSPGPIRLTLQPWCHIEFDCYQSFIYQRLLIEGAGISVGQRESAAVPDQGFAIYTSGFSQTDGFVDNGKCNPANYRPGIGLRFTLFELSPTGG